MRYGTLSVKKRKLWPIKWTAKVVDSSRRRTVAWVLGNRATATFQRLYDKVKHLADCTFYTDKWEAFAKVLLAERHVIGKAHTACIERDNSNTKCRLNRFVQRAKVVSKCEKMVDSSLRIWHAVTTSELLEKLQEKLMAIFR